MAKKKTTAKKSPAKKSNSARMLVVEARFYVHIADALWTGTKRALDDAGAQYDRITVPGALEIPAAIAMAVDAASKKRNPYDGVVALGCVIEGETYHFEVVSNESARGLMDLAIARQLPIGNGILTVDTETQALVRANPEDGDKGGDAARAALTMVALKRSLAGR
jgi:6,7-dimethyl-8-ribityllumazine synthase